MVTRTSVAAIVFMLFVSSAAAEERLGVAVYPGAKYDPDRTRLLRHSLSVRGAAYRTDAAAEKVMEFYRKQGLLLLKTGRPSKEHARFQKAGTGVDVVVAAVQKDPQKGAKMPDTLILIFKKEEERGSRPEDMWI